MKKYNSDFFQKFDGLKINDDQKTSITGGVAIGGGISHLAHGGDTRVTGDTDCTGDYISPDCGDGSSTGSDSTPTSSKDDGCY